MPQLLPNTAGEPEWERRFRRANVIEALNFACLVLAVLWVGVYGLGAIGGFTAARQMGHWPLVIAIAWVLIGSPFWHGDRLESLGLGNPLRLYRAWRERRGAAAWRIVAPALILFCVLCAASLANWPDTVRMFKLGSAARAWPEQSGGLVKMLLFSGALSAFVALCVVRYDNFWPAFKVALCVSGALLLYAAAAGMLHRGPAAFERIQLTRIPLEVLAYAFWGGLQQYLFTAYFATRLRKGFAPSRSPQNIIPPERRPRAILLGALAAAATIAPAVWLIVRMRSGAAEAPFALLFWCCIFALPVGAVWTHYYCRDKRRMLVATLSGSFFGLIHIDSYGLVLVTFGLGTILAYVFMEDRYRNLSALAFIHGFLGSTFGKIFGGSSAGALRVNYRVGPWSVTEPSPAVLIIPVLCILIFAALLIVCAQRIRD